ncbi:hypothetical protein [Rhodohalobacter mucosus]|uniref:Phage shock protein B n=1 Tax=Rhodohalobacter mucosus TaxID=2079485 RepID=A0A316TMU2_9BACT|nr:hypothetical protein [Rhodohalobacter mucosus]PWN05933.1 hypothetical protein DDZ15_12165 [Rhodohalobacter mucosus]
MSSFIWILIPLVAIIGGYIIDYQKNKLKWQSRYNRTDEEVDDLRDVVSSLKQRIENLEAIAAGSPETFSDYHSDSYDRIDFEKANSIKSENEQTVAKKAKMKGD